LNLCRSRICDRAHSRFHPKEQIDKLKRAIEKFGFLVPVLVDDRNRVIVGHARMEAAKGLGFAEIPVSEYAI
jgi:ParB-like chromosome segregation protein Spo0J